MDERLKAAVDKALERRSNAGVTDPASVPRRAVHERQLAPQQPQTVLRPGSTSGPDLWALLQETDPDRRVLERERIVTRSKSHRAHKSFDHLRTRLLRALDENGWNRIAITSPTPDCGKTMVSANLAFSLARQPEVRTVLMDMDLRAPSVAQRLGISERHRIQDFLSGTIMHQDFLRRVGQNLVVGLNHDVVRDSAELMQSQHMASVLANMLASYRPHVVIYDLPPMLAGDDVIAFLPNVDAVLLVAAAGQTKPAEITECEQMIKEHSRFLGILLNKSTEAQKSAYKYDYG